MPCMCGVKYIKYHITFSVISIKELNTRGKVGMGCDIPCHLCPSFSSSSITPLPLILLKFHPSEVGAVASQAEERKEAKYAHFNAVHPFSPVAIETSGVFAKKALAVYANDDWGVSLGK